MIGLHLDEHLTMNRTDILDRLCEVIRQRKSASSYVAGLMAGGVDAIGAKIIEEAHEVCDASAGDDRGRLVSELSDLLFHALVLAGYRDVSLDEIRAEFGRRFGTSGLTEKAGRDRR